LTDRVSRIVLASGNKHKLVEIKALLADLPLTVATSHDFPRWPIVEEDGSTFKENALKKAMNGFEHTGLPCIADDSGLEVDALGGRPGVHSSRYAGESASDAENNAKLLRELANIPSEKRTARFCCVIAFVFPGRENKEMLFSAGTCEGRIGYALQGTNGFGYDPLFIPTGYERTYAQLSAEEKNMISHRARALSDFKEKLRVWLHTI
jgi:XTP/dITP diphosphohydrolase